MKKITDLIRKYLIESMNTDEALLLKRIPEKNLIAVQSDLVDTKKAGYETYKNKETLKKNKFVWNSELSAWVAPDQNFQDAQKTLNAINKKEVFIDKLEDLRIDFSLGDFFAKNFVEKWQFLVSKLFQNLSAIPRHAALFSEYEPGLASYYQALAERVESDPQATIIALFNCEKDRQYDVDVLLPIKAKKEAHLFCSLPKVRSKTSLEKLLRIHLENLANPEVLALELMMQFSIFPKCALSLSVDIFTDLFARYGERFIAWLKHFLSAKSVLLCINEECIVSLSELSSWPWTRVLPLQNSWLLEGLLALGFAVNKRGEAGFAPLQEAVRLNLPQMLAPLIERGANKNMLLEGKTLLLFALELQANNAKESYESMLETLVALDIPYNAEDFVLKLKCAEEFAARKKFDYQAALFLNNPDLAWAFSLQAISQSEKPEKNPIILRGIGTDGYLKPAVYQQIAREGMLLKDNDYGRHRVTSFCIPLPACKLGVHFKEKPEFIGREIQAHSLGQILFPGEALTPQVAHVIERVGFAGVIDSAVFVMHLVIAFTVGNHGRQSRQSDNARTNGQCLAGFVLLFVGIRVARVNIPADHFLVLNAAVEPMFSVVPICDFAGHVK